MSLLSPGTSDTGSDIGSDIDSDIAKALEDMGTDYIPQGVFLADLIRFDCTMQNFVPLMIYIYITDDWNSSI